MAMVPMFTPEKTGPLVVAAKCALADLLAVMPVFEPDGDKLATGWETIVDLYDGLTGLGIDVSDYSAEVDEIRNCVRCPRDD